MVERSYKLRRALEERINTTTEMRVLYSALPLGANAARNLGVSSSTGDIVAFVDDDAFLDSNWSEALLEAYQDESVLGVTGPIIPIWEDQSTSWWPRQLEWVIGCTGWTGFETRRAVRGVLGTNATFRRSALHPSPFNETLGPKEHRFSERREWGEMGEETELSLRIRATNGGTVMYDPGVIIYHEVPRFKTTLAYLAQRAYQVGRTKKMIKRLNKYEQNDLLGPEIILLRNLLTNIIMPWLQKESPRNYFRTVLFIAVSVAFVGMGYEAPR